ncbi:KpsF/GutQ family sugar-phosphate isomerase [Marinilongibacter aquaticus]|uniref:KpsF/GutQ family sugar-phosphate isomerase n=1 Tax=Marinilongibacter aquaticus TaxID=2975157 RepID=UPI0021BDEA5E|nr:KpsF/GutQ family sugar-phosphate isomerase [Marinilongibacter aquaticus]UBM60648.1 KpsF/GutQ family sugar-phosphate isomerase [Marinilongibacter aquaticus]
MNTKIDKNILEIGKKVLSAESEAILSLKSSINTSFQKAIDLILDCKGKVVLTGVGKSAFIAQKISATMNSTGQQAVFLHSSDALHGDIGILDKNDIVLALSKSGETEEVINLLPYLKKYNNVLIALTGNVESTLAKASNCILDASVAKEACTNNLAPTSSTTAALALGDALSICLMEARNFTEQDFAKNHPAGSLGKKMLLRVSDIYPNNAIATVSTESKIQDVIIEISSKRIGATAVLDEDQKLAGIVTDGDLRRMIRQHQDFTHLKAKDIMSAKPLTVAPETMAIDALNFMNARSITQLIVAKEKDLLGFVHLHDLLKAGLS